MRLYLVCRILQTADEDQLFGPAGEVPQSSLSGTVNKRRHIRCKHYFMRLVSIPNQIIKNKKRFFFWRAFSDHSFSRLTWRLSFLLVRAPSVRAGFEHSTQQQQHGLLPLITVSWCQIAVRELTQPFHKPCRMYRMRFLRMQNRQRKGKTAKKGNLFQVISPIPCSIKSCAFSASLASPFFLLFCPLTCAKQPSLIRTRNLFTPA